MTCLAALALAAQLDVARALRRWERTRSHRAREALVWARVREMAL